MRVIRAAVLVMLALAAGFVVSQPSVDSFSKVAHPTAALAAGEEATKMDWRMLRELNYRTGKVSPALKALDGKLVKIPGYMVPLEDDAEIVTEFLLVPYVGACIHTPPPPPNQIVQVQMQNSKKVKLSFWDPIWIYGKLQIATVKSPYGDVGFQLTGTQLEPYKDE